RGCGGGEGGRSVGRAAAAPRPAKPARRNVARRDFSRVYPERSGADSAAAIVLPKRLLIANRGEIAIRIARAAGELGIATVTVFSADDAASLHVRRGDRAHPLAGVGTAAYLDAAGLVAAARDEGCDAIHPGYGFLSENGAFAGRCREADIVFVGPRSDLLDLFGDKAQARALAVRCGVPVLPGT